MREHLLLEPHGLEEVAGELKWAQYPGDPGLHPRGDLFPHALLSSLLEQGQPLG